MADLPTRDETPDDEFATRFSDPEETVTSDDEYATIGSPVLEKPQRRELRYDALVRGDQIGDFRIQRLLGQGSFGAVYLARELMLDRLVALKVVLPDGQRASAGEGRNLARLKHPNIVGVFGEAKDPKSGCSLLWMQFVDGCNLARLIEQLHRGAQETWSENDLRRLMTTSLIELDSEGDSIRSTESISRLGEKLAEALDHAHESGITHRDIKPANILVDRDGTALLADFNLAEETESSDQSSGGTIAYMPPEQLARLLGDRDAPTVGPRSDIYSLGVVLWELACGQRPHANAESSVKASSSGQRLGEYLKLRRQQSTTGEEEIPIGLAMVLRRAMMPDPADRYPSAAAMATALRGLSELQRARRRAPMIARHLQFIRRNLFWIILVGGLFPHFAASVFQTAYNDAWIEMSGDAFKKAFISYNIIVYPACIGWLAWNLYQFRSGYRQLLNGQPIDRGKVRRLRGRLLKLPRQFMIVSAVGWFPGAVLFAYLVGFFEGQALPAKDRFHFFISWTIAGLIATTYSYSIVLYIVVCHGYRACWQTASRYRDRVRYELAHMEGKIEWLAILAGTLPLAAAVLLSVINLPSEADIEIMASMVRSMPPEEAAQTVVDRGYQIKNLTQLVIALIVFGAIGLYVVDKASARMIRAVRALTLADE